MPRTYNENTRRNTYKDKTSTLPKPEQKAKYKVFILVISPIRRSIVMLSREQRRVLISRRFVGFILLYNTGEKAEDGAITTATIWNGYFQ